MRKLKRAEIDRVSRSSPIAARHLVTVVIENVRSAYNVGAILRTCDAALVDRVIVTGYTPLPDHPKVRKTALGAEKEVPWEAARETAPLIRRLKTEGYTIAALEITDQPSRVEDLGRNQFPLALIVGNEVAGVSDEAIALADLAIEIPQYGIKQSLNVAVAFGIAMMGVIERFRSIHPTHLSVQKRSRPAYNVRVRPQ